MTFAQPFDIRAGLPLLYLLLALILTVSVQAYLLILYLEQQLDAIWFFFSLALSVFLVILAYFSNQRQKSYYLHWQGNRDVFKLYSKDKALNHEVSVSKYTIQTDKLVFVRFSLASSGNMYLLFHQDLNEDSSFRRFKVQLSWSELN